LFVGLEEGERERKKREGVNKVQSKVEMKETVVKRGKKEGAKVAFELKRLGFVRVT